MRAAGRSGLVVSNTAFTFAQALVMLAQPVYSSGGFVRAAGRSAIVVILLLPLHKSLYACTTRVQLLRLCESCWEICTCSNTVFTFAQVLVMHAQPVYSSRGFVKALGGSA